MEKGTWNNKKRFSKQIVQSSCVTIKDARATLL